MSTEKSRSRGFALPRDVQAELKAEAARLDRTVSWVVQRAWKLARRALRDEPGPP